jgi:hypothetical protein
MKHVILSVCYLLGGSICLLAQDAASLAAIRDGRRLSSTVSVIAFDTNGKFLGSPSVSVFEDPDDRNNLAAKFQKGVAAQIPYGMYRIVGYLTGYSSDMKYVWVYQSHVSVVLGLEIGAEKPVIPPTLHGRVVGSVSEARSFVRLVSVYSSSSVDSAISSDGNFDLSVPPGGKFLLLVIGERGVLASRAISLPYTGPPLEVSVEGSQQGK